METQTRYTCHLDARGWQLYTYEDEEGMSRERARAKRRGASLSKRLTKLVRKAQDELAKNPRLDKRKLAIEVRDKMYKLMSKYDDDGARDTEPECTLIIELERAFDLGEYELDR